MESAGLPSTTSQFIIHCRLSYGGKVHFTGKSIPMGMDPTLSKAIKTAQEGLTLVIRDLKARPDYSKNPNFATYVNTFNSFSQDLLNAEAQTTLTQVAKTTLLEKANDVVLPLIEKLINNNIAITQMGTLNLNRTITPTMATANNVNLNAEQTAVQKLVAQLIATTSMQDPTSAIPPIEILPETEVVSRFSTWARSISGEDVEAS